VLEVSRQAVSNDRQELSEVGLVSVSVFGAVTLYHNRPGACIMARAALPTLVVVATVVFLLTGNALGDFSSPTSSDTEAGDSEIFFTATFMADYFIGDNEFDVDPTLCDFYLKNNSGDLLVDGIYYSYSYNGMTDEYAFTNNISAPSYYPNPGGNLTVKLWGGYGCLRFRNGRRQIIF
jgi:hypothetical protein